MKKIKIQLALKVIIFFFLIVYGFNGLAQSEALFKIEYTVIDNKAEERVADLPIADKEYLVELIRERKFTLLINKQNSIYFHGTYAVYRDKNKKRWLKKLSLNGDPVWIAYDSIPLKWKITGERQKIGKYTAFKAVGIYRDKPVVAWFTPDIPLDGGPEFFHGLPGLILALDWNGRTYTATKIQSSREKIVPPPDNITPITQEEYVRRIKQQGMIFGGENGSMQIIIKRMD